MEEELSFKRLNIPLEWENKSYGPEQIAKSHDVRIYEGATLLTEGVWADSVSNSNVLYTAENLSKTQFKDNYINLGHDNANPLSFVGTIHNVRKGNGIIKADLWIDTITQNGRDVINLINAGRINNLSVEMGTRDVWNSVEHMKCAHDINIYGVSIVGPFQACKDARIR